MKTRNAPIPLVFRNIKSNTHTNIIKRSRNVFSFVPCSLYKVLRIRTTNQINPIPNNKTNNQLKKFISIAIVSAEIPKKPLENEKRLNQKVINESQIHQNQRIAISFQ